MHTSLDQKRHKKTKVYKSTIAAEKCKEEASVSTRVNNPWEVVLKKEVVRGISLANFSKTISFWWASYDERGFLWEWKRM